MKFNLTQQTKPIHFSFWDSSTQFPEIPTGFFQSFPDFSILEASAIFDGRESRWNLRYCSRIFQKLCRIHFERFAGGFSNILAGLLRNSSAAWNLSRLSAETLQFLEYSLLFLKRAMTIEPPPFNYAGWMIATLSISSN